MPLDQAHEQNNELIKGPGGAVGLPENPTAFRRWMIAGPQQARLMVTFEDQCLGENVISHQQHEQGLSSQERFKRKSYICVKQ